MSKGRNLFQRLMGKRSPDGRKPTTWDRWAEAARREGGRFVQGKKPEIRVEHGPWTITVDKEVQSNGQTTVTYTRTRAYFVANEDFAFRMSRRRWYSGIASAFGMREARIRDRGLEEKYVFRSKQENRLRSLLQDGELRRLIQAQPSLRLEVKGLGWWARRKRGSRVRVITARTTGVVDDVERIVSFIRLVAAGLDGLQRIGSALAEPVKDGHSGELPRRL